MAVEILRMNGRGGHKTHINIIRHTRTHDGAGGHVVVYDTDNKEPWFASIHSASTRVIEAGKQEQVVVTHTIHIDADPPGGIQKDDVIERESDGQWFQVSAVREGSEGTPTLWTYTRQKGY